MIFFFGVTLLIVLYRLYREPVNPVFLSLLIFVFYYFSVSLGSRVYITSSASIEKEWLIYGLVVCFSLLLASALAARVVIGKSRLLDSSVLKKSFFVFMLLVSPFALIEIFSVFKIIFAGNHSYGEMWEAKRSSIIFGKPTLMLAISLVFFVSMEKTIFNIAPYILLFFLAFYFFISGERGDLSRLFLIYIFLRFSAVKNKIFFPFLMVLLISLAGLYGNMRGSLSGGLISFVQMFFERIIDNPYILLPFDLNEFINVAALQKTSFDFKLDYGAENFYKVLLTATPILGRFFQDYFEPSIANRINDEYSAGLLEEGVITGTGNITMLGGELYLTFGAVGMFLALLLAFFLIKILFNHAVKLNGNNAEIYVIILALIFPFVVLDMHRTSFESLVYNTRLMAYIFIAVMLVYYILSSFKVNKHVPSE